MSAAKPTPGTWSVARSADRFAASRVVIAHPQGDLIIASVHGIGDERDATARLISATPELLAACEAEERVDQHWRECDECDASEGSGCEELQALVEEARRIRRAAISKAGGNEA